MLANNTYAGLMVQWLAHAQVLDNMAQLQTYCATNLAADPNPSDLVEYYTSLKDYTAVARMLPPMLPDVKVSAASFTVCTHRMQPNSNVASLFGRATSQDHPTRGYQLYAADGSACSWRPKKLFKVTKKCKLVNARYCLGAA